MTCDLRGHEELGTLYQLQQLPLLLGHQAHDGGVTRVPAHTRPELNTQGHSHYVVSSR